MQALGGQPQPAPGWRDHCPPPSPEADVTPAWRYQPSNPIKKQVGTDKRKRWEHFAGLIDVGMSNKCNLFGWLVRLLIVHWLFVHWLIVCLFIAHLFVWHSCVCWVGSFIWLGLSSFVGLFVDRLFAGWCKRESLVNFQHHTLAFLFPTGFPLAALRQRHHGGGSTRQRLQLQPDLYGQVTDNLTWHTMTQ